MQHLKPLVVRVREHGAGQDVPVTPSDPGYLKTERTLTSVGRTHTRAHREASPRAFTPDLFRAARRDRGCRRRFAKTRGLGQRVTGVGIEGRNWWLGYFPGELREMNF